MAGKGKKTFVAGEVLLAQDVNDYLMDQSVMNFASAAARSSAIPTPTEGMTTYVADDKRIEAYDNDGWRPKTPFAIASGTITLTGNGTVTFPASRFTVTPNVTATVSTTNGQRWGVSVVVASASSMTVYNWNGTALGTVSVGIFWTAIQMTSASANG
jgi:hypothetical protein